MCLRAGSGGKHTFVFLHGVQCLWGHNSLMKRVSGHARQTSGAIWFSSGGLRHARGPLEGIYWYRHLSSSNITSVLRGQQDNSRHSGW